MISRVFSEIAMALPTSQGQTTIFVWRSASTFAETGMAADAISD